MLANRVRMSRQLRDKFGAPILTEQGMFLDRWTASGTGTGAIVGQVYDNMLYLSADPDASVDDSATFLSDPVKVFSDALGWKMTTRVGLGGMVQGFFDSDRYLHKIPIGTVIKIGTTFSCIRAAIGTLVPARFELTLSIMDEDGESLGDPLINDPTQGIQVISIDSLKFV